MTAIVAIVKKDGIVVYSDGACYGRDGTLAFERQKTDVLMHIPCIIAARGEHQQGRWLKYALDWYDVRDFDGLVDLMPSLLTHAADFAPRVDEPINLCVLFGGWSERSSSWELYRAVVNADEGSEVKKVPTAFYSEPVPPREMLIAYGLMKDEGLDLRGGDQSMIRYMHCQRQAKFAFGPSHQGEESTGCIVGSFIQRTALATDEAATEIIYRWPDEVGEPLGLSYFDMTPKMLAYFEEREATLRTEGKPSELIVWQE
ncbi:hypothetical protein [Bradyrhizobium elkanii]|uniref:Uncharacterized protein n=1 Tax=Bradyrhizobium elkanii TaxID=29448 RepID=A0A8I1YJF1_BRAEL|nr:hypothetical protein [Bradyrhizobium elkanii]MBP1297468.1 hypothetical protein [Bradyrhizobium elkanii]